MFPLIKDFQATNISRAFILASLLLAIVASVTTEIRLYLEKDENKIFSVHVKDLKTQHKYFITFSISIIVSVLFYILFHYIFGYGGGMLADNPCNKKGVCSLPAGTLYNGKSIWDVIKDSFTLFPFKHDRTSIVANRVKKYKKIFKK